MVREAKERNISNSNARISIWHTYTSRLASDNYQPLIRTIDRVVFVVSLVIFLRTAYSYWPYLEDDVFIFIRYAIQFHAGHGWVMNPGERVNGCTSWFELWIVTLFTKSLTVDQTIEALKLLGVICGAGTLYFTRKLVDYCIPSVTCIGSLSCLLMVNIHCFTLSMVNALETPMACVFMTAGTYYAAINNSSTRKAYPYFSAICFLPAAFARPEMSLLFPAVFVIQSLHSRKLNFGPLLLFTVPLCMVLALSAAWYGSPLPNTYYAKYATFQQGVTEGGAYLLLCLFNNNWLLGITAATAAGWFVYSKDNKGRAAVLTVAVTYTIAILRTHGDWMQDERFATPLIPFMAASWVYALALAIKLLVRIKEYRAGLAYAACLILAWALAFCVKPALASVAHACDAYVRHNVVSHPVLWPPAAMRPFSMWMCGADDGRVSLAKWIEANARPGDTVAITEMGLVTCLNPDIRFLDILGLTDKTIAHLPDYKRSCVGVNSGDDWADLDTTYGSYIELRKPRYIIFPWSAEPPGSHHYVLAYTLLVHIDNIGECRFLIYKRKE